MRRPSAAREALSFRPLVKAGGAYACGVERVPRVSAGAEPFVLFAGRPSTEWAADARPGSIVALPLLSLAIQNSGLGGIARDGAHAR